MKQWSAGTTGTFSDTRECYTCDCHASFPPFPPFYLLSVPIFRLFIVMFTSFSPLAVPFVHFLKVNLLDNTRIHPECYLTHEWVGKVIRDAMEQADPTMGINELVRLVMQVGAEEGIKGVQRMGRSKESQGWHEAKGRCEPGEVTLHAIRSWNITWSA